MSNNFDYSFYDDLLFQKIKNLSELNVHFYVKSKINF